MKRTFVFLGIKAVLRNFDPNVETRNHDKVPFGVPGFEGEPSIASRTCFSLRRRSPSTAVTPSSRPAAAREIQRWPRPSGVYVDGNLRTATNTNSAQSSTGSPRPFLVSRVRTNDVDSLESVRMTEKLSKVTRFPEGKPRRK